MNKPCLICYRPSARGRCPLHQLKGRTHQEQTRRSSLIEAHLATYGPSCPGYNRGPHLVPASSLTADHVTPRSLGGEAGRLRVLCRACNTRRGNLARHDHQETTHH